MLKLIIFKKFNQYFLFTPLVRLAIFLMTICREFNVFNIIIIIISFISHSNTWCSYNIDYSNLSDTVEEGSQKVLQMNEV